MWDMVDFMIAEDSVSCYGRSTDNYHLGMSFYKYRRESG
jgi:hypothetical protein